MFSWIPNIQRSRFSVGSEYPFRKGKYLGFAPKEVGFLLFDHVRNYEIHEKQFIYMKPRNSGEAQNKKQSWKTAF